MSIEDKKEKLKKLLQNIKSKSFAEEIENDKNKIATYLKRHEEAFKNKSEHHLQEKLSTEVFKRVLIMAASNEINIHGHDKNGQGKTQLATQNNLPASTYLAHGGRIKIEIPADSDDSLINWITSGDRNKDGRSLKQDQNKALKENKVVYNRSAATHNVLRKKTKDQYKLVDGKNEFIRSQYELIEKKGFKIGAKDFASNKFLNAKTNHYGVDLALNAKFGDVDSLGQAVAKPDGDHGHLYIHYKPARPPKPGSILIGVEGAAPSSSKHSKTGASNPLTPIDGLKLRDLVEKKQQAGEIYKDTVIPKTIDGMNMKLSLKSIEELTQIKADSYGAELAEVMPSKSVEEFKIKMKNRVFHQMSVITDKIKSSEPTKLAENQNEDKDKTNVPLQKIGNKDKNAVKKIMRVALNNKIINKAKSVKRTAAKVVSKVTHFLG